MAKHVDVVFDKSSHSAANPALPNAGPGSISMCRGCCQILSTRTCSGKTTDTALGCDLHRKRPEIPVAIRSTITSVRLREMWKPNIVVERYYIEPKQSGNSPVHLLRQTNLMHVGWVRRIREGNRETKRSKKVYMHDESGCIYSKDPESILQGLGPRYLYFKRCDGQFINAFGEALEITEPKNGWAKKQPESSAAAAKIPTAVAPDALPPVDGGPLTIEPDQQSLADTVQEGTETVNAKPDKQLSDCDDFNEKANPWADIQPLPTPDSVPELEAAMIDDIKGLRKIYDLEQSDLSPTDLESGWQEHWKACCDQLDAKKESAGEDTVETISPPAAQYVEPDSSRHNSTSAGTPALRSLTPSATFLMPYEFAAAKKIEAELAPPPTLPVELNHDPAKVAELAWRRHNMAKVAEEAKEIADEKKARRRKGRWWKLWH